MTTLARALRRAAFVTAISAFTITPLMGFFVGDKRPSAAATALQMFLAVLLMSAALVVTVIDRARRRKRQAAEIYRRAVARGAGRDPDDRFAASRQQAHDAGLPWIEADGTVTWPERSRVAKP